MAEARGSCDSAFQSVRDLFHGRIAQGGELGASLCVNIDGKNVIDLWGGHADSAKTKPWNEDTLTVVWSCSTVDENGSGGRGDDLGAGPHHRQSIFVPGLGFRAVGMATP